MEQQYIEDKTYNKQDLTGNKLTKGNYERCTFTGCDLSDANLSGCNFSECMFDGCNLSLAKLGKTALRDVTFRNCKMLGLHFNDCNPFGLEIRFEHCQLNHCSFYSLSLKATVFDHCNLLEADFTDADLASTRFSNCDLSGATFDNTNLEKADLSTATGYIINPERNKIKKARFSLPDITGLLVHHDIIIEA